VNVSVVPKSTTATSASVPQSSVSAMPSRASSRSIPASPLMLSVPRPPVSLFGPVVPLIVSLPDPPVAFSKVASVSPSGAVPLTVIDRPSARFA
jgi:hypothetical protein